MSIWTNPDERSAAFFALGIAKALRQPAALICTSGTAAANYFPAVIEARMSGTPLIVITADRPPHLRGIGAPQTINQLELYGGYSVYFEDLPLPTGESDIAAHWSATAQIALDKSRSDPGPVHLNAPFDEPLLPDPEAIGSCVESARAVTQATRQHAGQSSNHFDSDAIAAIADLLSRSRRPLVVCGPQDDEHDLVSLAAELAQKLDAPILADAASQLRQCPSVISHYDLVLRDERVGAYLAPDVILRLGGMPVSKSLNEWIASTPATVKIGIAKGAVADPHKCLSHSLQGDPALAVKSLLEKLGQRQAKPSQYHDDWMTVNQAAARVLTGDDAGFGDILESRIVAYACERAGREMNLFLSNSMPIRWADMYARARAGFPRVLVNRGANGIDGIISTAAGAAVATELTTICILGDLTFLHDQNGLWRLAEARVPLKLIILNNDGGGVFHFLPVTQYSTHFEPLVAMPHGVDLSCVAKAHGLPFQSVQTYEQFSARLEECLGRSGPEFIEVRSNRALNASHQQEMVRRVAKASRTALGLS